MKTKYHSDVVGAEAAGCQAYGVATGIYNKHRIYLDQWNPWHPFDCAYDFQQAQSLCQNSKTWIDQHLKHGLDDFRIESFQSATELWALLESIDFGLGAESWLEDSSQTFGTLYYRDIFRCIKFLLAYIPFATHLDFELVRLADSEGCHVYSEMNTGNWWWDTQEQLPQGATIVPVIFAFDKTHLTNFSGDKQAWPLYMTIGNI